MDKTYSQLARLVVAFFVLTALLLAGQGFYDLETIIHFTISIISILSIILISLRLMNEKTCERLFAAQKLIKVKIKEFPKFYR
jgi:hypothetical protein